MKVIYATQPLVELKNSVALLGPTPRDALTPSWRPKFIETLSSAGFDGTIIVPEPSDGKFSHSYINQVEWELEMIEKSELISFWVPRELFHMAGFTTNIELGFCLGKQKRTIYGRPNDAEKIKYCDFLHHKFNLSGQDKPYNNIRDMAIQIVKYFGAK